MGFFLVGHGHTAGDIHLVTDKLFEDRKTALAELSRLSAAPEFAHRDDEVFVVDLSSAVPVLVVAPQATESEVAEDEIDTKTEQDVSETEPSSIESDNEDTVSETDVEETAGVWDAPTDDEEEALDVEAVTEDAEDPVPLADALKRAAGALESEGITPPESVGPTEPASWPWEAESSDSSDDSDDAFVPSALEEPAIDGDAGMLASPDPEDDSPIRRPVIMGDYADDEIAPAPPVSDFGDETPVELVSEELPKDVPSPPVEVSEDSEAISLEAIESDSDIGGILADLETIEDPKAELNIADMPVTTKADTPSETDQDTSELTCEDCVYVTTCPNKDELIPSSCGNFQWKAV